MPNDLAPLRRPCAPVSDRAASHAAAIDVAPGRPARLDGPAVAWRVAEGTVDVYAELVAPDGAVRHRDFVTEAGPGDLVFGADPADGLALWATARDRARLVSADPGGADLAAVARWLDAVGEAAGRIGGPPPATPDEALTRLRGVLGAAVAAADARFALGAERTGTLAGRALDRLAAVASRRRPAVEGSPLLAACRLVGEALGVEVPEVADDAGAPLASRIDRIAAAARLRARPVTLRGAWWREDCGALLAFRRDDGAPVALVAGSGGRCRMLDPAGGPAVAVDEGVARSLSPSAYVFYRTLPDRPLGPLDIARFAFGRGTGDLLTVLACGFASGLIGLALPLATAAVLDEVVPGHLKSQLVQIGAALVVAALVQVTFQTTQSVAMMRFEARATVALQAAVVDRVLRLPSRFFRGFSTGDLGQRAMVINQIGQLVTGTLLSSLFAAVFSVFSVGLLFAYEPRAALVAVALSVLLAVLTTAVGVHTVVAMRRREHLVGRLSSLVFEMVNGIDRIRLAGAETRIFARWAGLFADMRRHAIDAQAVRARFVAFNAGYRLVAMAAVFAALVHFGEGRLGTGAFIAFVAAFTSSFEALSRMADAVVELLLIVPLYGRAKPILAAVPEAAEARADPGVLSGGIEISGVSFRYADDMPPVLRNLSLKVRAGEFVAVAGRSGCGKSTLFRLLLGFERPVEGAVYYDGRDLAGLDLPAVRRQIGTVLQHDLLIAGSIYENIRGATAVSVAEAMEAARLAGIAEDIEAMPMGLHTMVADNPAFSGGQVQRLLIARALAAKPRILLFDEATSALDNRTQAIVAASLNALPVTRIAIAHRLSTVIGADRICVLDDGEVAEIGTYDELMVKGGLFAELARRQLS